MNIRSWANTPTQDRRSGSSVFSTRITFPWSEGGPLICCPFRSRYCHSSMRSVASLKYLVSLLSRSGTSNVRLCVLEAVSKALSSGPLPSLTWPSALACSFVKRRPLPVDRHVFSDFCGLAQHFLCALQSLLCIHASFFMSWTGVADFSEGVA